MIRRTDPKHGDGRERKRLILFPKSINGETRFLGVGHWVEVYYQPESYFAGKWIQIKWSDQRTEATPKFVMYARDFDRNATYYTVSSRIMGGES